jgi:hypothetical protein
VTRRLLCAAATVAIGIGLTTPGMVTGAGGAEHDCPSAAAGYTRLAAVGLSAPPGAEVATKDSRLAACFLAFDGSGHRWTLGMDYLYTRHEYTGVAGRDRDLHRLQLPIGLSLDAGHGRLDAFVAPGVATSSNVFKDLGSRYSGDDFLLTGRIEARIHSSPGSAWLIGLAHDRSFGESRSWPVAGIEYHPTASVGLRLAWPDPALSLARSDRQSLLVEVFPAGQRWHVVSDELGERFDYRMEAWRARATWSIRIAASVVIDVSVGWEFGREHGFTDDTGRRIETGAEDGALVGIGLRVGGGPLPRGRGPTLPRFTLSTAMSGESSLRP